MTHENVNFKISFLPLDHPAYTQPIVCIVDQKFFFFILPSENGRSVEQEKWGKKPGEQMFIANVSRS